MVDHLRAGLCALLALFSVLPQAVAQSSPFRLCADPDNPPLSSRAGPQPGIYVELGQQIAAALGRPLQMVWTPDLFAHLGTRLRQGQCDSVIGLPEHASAADPRVIYSRPLFAVGYALVSPSAKPVDGLSGLTGKRVAVQYGSPPQSLLSGRPEIHLVTVMEPREGLDALAAGSADAALLWGPSCGWINKTRLHGAYAVRPVAGKDLRWSVVMAFASTQVGLRDAVDHALAGLQDRTQSLLRQYGLATAEPVTLTASHPAAPPAQAAASAGDSAQEVATGHQLFNFNCEHCHGHDAIQGLEPRNLRDLHKRYGDKMDQVFLYTVTHGRPAKGMPNWSGILTEAQFRAILAWLHSVQAH